VSKIIYYPATKESAAVAYIHDVIPPDEYVDHVNNSIYTNYGAALALRIAADASDYLSIPYSSSYREIANAIVLPLDDETQIHPEYDGYDWGTIKQADVVLLHFPLEMEMSYESQVADLDFYSQVTDINGPAMTWGMHSIGYRDLLRFDTAAQYLNLSFQDNLQSPFNVWTETVSINIHYDVYLFLLLI
jgi:trehalose/maltose hydrolase-like predicted phosphorylase